MANEVIIQFRGDNKQLTQVLSLTDAQLESIIQSANIVNADLKKGFDSALPSIAQNTQHIKALTSEILKATEASENLQIQNKQTGTAGKTTSGADMNSVIAFSGIIQDIPYGVRGVANNITFLTQTLATATLTTGSLTTALRAMWVSMVSNPISMILIGISAVTTAMLFLDSSSKKADESMRKVFDKETDAVISLQQKLETTNANNKISEEQRLAIISELNAKHNASLDINSTQLEINERINTLLSERKQQILENARYEATIKHISDQIYEQMQTELEIEKIKNGIAQETKKLNDERLKGNDSNNIQMQNSINLLARYNSFLEKALAKHKEITDEINNQTSILNKNNTDDAKKTINATAKTENAIRENINILRAQRADVEINSTKYKELTADITKWENKIKDTTKSTSANRNAVRDSIKEEMNLLDVKKLSDIEIDKLLAKYTTEILLNKTLKASEKELYRDKINNLRSEQIKREEILASKIKENELYKEELANQLKLYQLNELEREQKKLDTKYEADIKKIQNAKNAGEMTLKQYEESKSYIDKIYDYESEQIRKNNDMKIDLMYKQSLNEIASFRNIYSAINNLLIEQNEFQQIQQNYDDKMKSLNTYYDEYKKVYDDINSDLESDDVYKRESAENALMTKYHTDDIDVAKTLYDDEYLKIVEDENKNKLEITKQYETAILNYKLDKAKEFMNAMQGLFSEQTAMYKAFAIAQITVDLYKGIMAAIGQSGPLGILMGATVAAQAAAAIKNVSSVQVKGYSKGGTVVGENGIEIIQPMQDYASGQVAMINAVVNKLNNIKSEVIYVEANKNKNTNINTDNSKQIHQFRLSGTDLVTASERTKKVRRRYDYA